jgi:hypothetical protein
MFVHVAVIFRGHAVSLAAVMFHYIFDWTHGILNQYTMEKYVVCHLTKKFMLRNV